MSFIQRELDRISGALRESPGGHDYEQLYAAQQALAWATEPHGYASPMKMITGHQVESEDQNPQPQPEINTLDREPSG